MTFSDFSDIDLSQIDSISQISEYTVNNPIDNYKITTGFENFKKK